jgi:hypothetical protein
MATAGFDLYNHCKVRECRFARDRKHPQRAWAARSIGIIGAPALYRPATGLCLIAHTGNGRDSKIHGAGHKALWINLDKCIARLHDSRPYLFATLVFEELDGGQYTFCQKTRQTG